MSALTASQVLVPSGVLLASLLGSAHCVGMCGGLVLATCNGAGAILRYHLGRAVAYAMIGMVAGAAGKAFLGAGFFTWVPCLSSGVLALALVGIGVSIATGRSPHWSPVPRSWLLHGMRTFGGSPGALGALSALLPCGWLHTFALGATATQSVVSGAAFMAAFWLGTLPALSVAPWFARRFLRPLGARAPWVAAAILVASGLSGLGLRLAATQGSAEARCPMHSQSR